MAMREPLAADRVLSYSSAYAWYPDILSWECRAFYTNPEKMRSGKLEGHTMHHQTVMRDSMRLPMCEAGGRLESKTR